MKNRIQALLTAQFSGMRKDALESLAETLSKQVTTDEEAKTLVAEITSEYLSDFVKDFRKQPKN